MTDTVKPISSTAAAAEIDRRCERLMADRGIGYREAYHITLKADKQLAEAYAQPAPAEKRSQPAVPVVAADEREIREWLLRALRDNMEGALPGALGSLALEAAEFKKIGMPIEEAARRAMDGNPHLLAVAKLLLADVRRNAPDKPVPADEAAQTPGDVADSRAQALTDKHPDLSYSAALHQVLNGDPALKSSYART